MSYQAGNRVVCEATSIQRSSGAAWKGDRGTVVEVNDGDQRVKVRWDNGATTDSVPWSEVRRA